MISLKLNVMKKTPRLISTSLVLLDLRFEGRKVDLTV